jgi:NAD(P)H-hydrate epimerase
MAANRAVDDYAINTCGIPGQTLMQNAGEGVVERLGINGYLEGKPRILVLAGKGNNGGDGFVIAKRLHQENHLVSLITISDVSELRGDALHHFLLLADLNLHHETWVGSDSQRKLIHHADLIVDALLGTGISGEMRPPYAELIQLCNQSAADIVAVDLPSGVSGDHGGVLKPCIQASLTISMGFGKSGCLFEPARSHSGVIETVDIGFPKDSTDRLKERVLYQTQHSDFPPDQFTRSAASHKYSVGKVYLIAGSRGYSGAALLASTAALRSGAGMVKLAIPQSLGSVAEAASLETIVEYLPETTGGSFAETGKASLLDGGAWSDTVVIGPGIGRAPETLNLVRELIREIDHPMVIDADALFAIKDNLDLLKDRSAPSIITPHVGEFLRLGDHQSKAEPPYWREASDFAHRYQTHVILKGAPSLIAYPDGTIIFNNTGHAGMATAGSGDVLSGVLGGLWAQWPDHPDILRFGMYIHGKAAEHISVEKGILGMIAGDITEALPTVLKEYGGLQI